MKLLERLISKMNEEHTDIIEIDVNHQTTYKKKKERKVESNNQETQPYTERESLSGEFQESFFEKEETGAETFGSKRKTPFPEEMSSEPTWSELRHSNITMTSLYADIMPSENGKLANMILEKVG